jgi:DNA-binding HxlR family transcriptional regulator
MEADDLIIRTEYPQIPPKVEYSLSDKGRSLYPLMEIMCAWGEDHQ